MLREKIDAVILDVDGTLSPEVSWLKLTQGLGASRSEHARIFSQFGKNEIDYPTAKDLLLRLWQETGNANRKFMKQMFQSWELKEDAKDVVGYLQHFYAVCLISGAVDLYFQVVAEKLQVMDWYANTELDWDEKGNLSDFHYSRDQAAKKLEHFRQYAKDKGLDKRRCAVIGNGDSDIILFKELRYGIAVDTDLHNEVRPLAYKIISHLSEVRGIL